MIQLGERDHEIIKYLRDAGWALAPQVADRFFKSSRHGCANRLRQLVNAGIIECLSLSAFRSKYWHEKGLLNLTCTINGRTKVYRLSESVRESLGKRWQRSSSEQLLAHQVLLGKVRETFERSFQGATFVYEGSESLRIAKNGEAGSILPDLVCHIDGLKIAVELERKARRGIGTFNTAYEDRFAALALEYDAVLYVVENEDHLKPLMKKADGRGKIGFSSILNPQEIFRLGREPVALETFVEEHERSVA